MNYKTLLLILCLFSIIVSHEIAFAQNVSLEMQKLLDAKDDKRCREIGAKPKSQAYVTCRLQMMQMRQQTYSPMVPQQPAVIYAPQPYVVPQPYQLPMPRHIEMPRQTNCTSDVIGQQVYTNCQQN